MTQHGIMRKLTMTSGLLREISGTWMEKESYHMHGQASQGSQY